MSVALIFNERTPKEEYDELFLQDMGTVFKIESGYETVMRRIEEYKPSEILFKVFPINPGTDLYTIYGPDHSIITDNRALLKT